MLDEQCLLPGNVTDMTFLEKLNQACKDHPHYESRKLKKNQSDRTLPHDAFRLKHYAGNVSYSMVYILYLNWQSASQVHKCHDKMCFGFIYYFVILYEHIPQLWIMIYIQHYSCISDYTNFMLCFVKRWFTSELII